MQSLSHFLWNHAIIIGIAIPNSIAIVAIAKAHSEVRKARREIDKLLSARSLARSESFEASQFLTRS